MKRIILFVPGILQWWWRINWDGKANTWFNLNTEFDLIDRTDYFCTAIGRAFHQQQRINRVKHTLRPYLNLPHTHEVSLVAHSNGTDLVLEALKQMRWPRIQSLHLLSGACEADFNKNGLNTALSTRRVERCYVYVAGKDAALRLAHGWLGKLLGFATLGLHGPLNILTSVDPQVDVTTARDYGHSDWFLPEHFDATMQMCRRV